MKKLIALLAALTMLFVCGCGSNSKDNGTDNGNGTNNAVAPTTLLMSGATPTRIPSVMMSATAWTMQAMPSETRWMRQATPSATVQTP